MNKAFLFIDGFNLYHAIMSDRHLRAYRWLNYRALGESLLTSTQQLGEVFYFTAFYPGKPAKQVRHRNFIQAQHLLGVTTVLGTFRRKHKHCNACGQTSLGYEEKETDVNIAVTLLEQAMNGAFDTAFILSNDSDLLPAIHAVRRIAPKAHIRMIFPPGGASESLKLAADSYMRLKEKHLAANLLPDPLVKDGITITKPIGW